MARNKEYEKLTPEQKHMIDMVQENLEKGTVPWQQGWVTHTPESAVSKKKYHGANCFYLTLR